MIKNTGQKDTENLLDFIQAIMTNTQTLHDIHLKQKNLQNSKYFREITFEIEKLLNKKQKSKNTRDSIKLLTKYLTYKKNWQTQQKRSRQQLIQESKIFIIPNIENFIQYHFKQQGKQKQIQQLKCWKSQITQSPLQQRNCRNYAKLVQNQAESNTKQEQTLQQFLMTNGIKLPSLSKHEQKELLEEITKEEIQWALNNTAKTSAPGLTGHTASFYKLIFASNPDQFTKAINQLTFIPGIINQKKFEWVRKRKIIYIPKIEKPRTPSDYRPLSMLEVFYKIPMRIFAQRISLLLPKLIGPHQFGFIKRKGIQQPILLTNQIIQLATERKESLQILSFDIEKSFNKTSHDVIKQSLYAFKFPNIIIEAISELALSGPGQAEVNGILSIEFPIQTGSGQGHPISSILFLIATEPLNIALNTLHKSKIFQSTKSSNWHVHVCG